MIIAMIKMIVMITNVKKKTQLCLKAKPIKQNLSYCFLQVDDRRINWANRQTENVPIWEIAASILCTHVYRSGQTNANKDRTGVTADTAALLEHHSWTGWVDVTVWASGPDFSSYSVISSGPQQLLKGQVCFVFFFLCSFHSPPGKGGRCRGGSEKLCCANSTEFISNGCKTEKRIEHS